MPMAAITPEALGAGQLFDVIVSDILGLALFDRAEDKV